MAVAAGSAGSWLLAPGRDFSTATVACSLVVRRTEDELAAPGRRNTAVDLDRCSSSMSSMGPCLAAACVWDEPEGTGHAGFDPAGTSSALTAGKRTQAIAAVDALVGGAAAVVGAVV